jgi:hypothetical protein
VADPLDRRFFEPYLETQFQVAGGPIALQLVECKRMKSYPGEPREPFSLLFRGPAEPMLPQKSYALSNEHTGPIEIFLVPVGRDAAGLLYEAVFN